MKMISLILKEIVRIKKKRQRSPLSYIYKKKERKKKSQVKIYDLFYIITTQPKDN